MAENKRELYERTQRRLIASLLFDSSSISRVLELVNDEDIEEPSYSLIFSAIAELSRRNETISPISVAEELQNCGKLKESGGPPTLYKLSVEGEKYLIEAPAEVYARIVKESSAKAKISRALMDSEKNFDDDSGVQASVAVSDLQSVLNDRLLELSDASSISRFGRNFDSYLNLLDERKQISEENGSDADGLQGVPSLFPSLNRYTTGWLPGQLVTIGARTGIGKALDIETPILTNDGWKKLKNVRINNFVVGRDGRYARVTNVTDTMFDRECWRITFDDGSNFVADAEHQWVVTDLWDDNREKVVNTLDIVENFDRFVIRAGDSISFSARTIEADPYEMGRWLSEYSFLPNIFVTEEIIELLGFQKEKFVPEQYFFNSFEIRKRLLTGFLDNIGYVDILGKVFFSTKDKRLMESIVSLINSLGSGKAIVNTTHVGDMDVYIVEVNTSYNPFSMKRKKDMWRNNLSDNNFSIVDVEKVDSVPVKCLEVDNDDHTYLAGHSLIPTHNSVFAIDCAISAAKSNHSVMFFSLEMSKTEIEDRLFAATTGIPMNKLKQGNLDSEERKRLATQMEDMKNMKLIIDVEPKVTIDSIRARALRQAQTEEGLDFIIVDYLQLVTPTGRFSSRQEAVSDISRNMKLLAKQLEIPIMVLVQLNREKDDEGTLPKLDQIRESGAIAQDSDIVILLHRDQALDDSTPNTIIILAKNRNGEANKKIFCHSNLECSLLREIPRVRDIERMTEEDMIESEESFDLDGDLDDFDLDDMNLDEIGDL